MAKKHRKIDQPPQTDNKSLKRHMKTLGIASEKEYQRWCRKHGLGSGLHKSQNQRDKERILVARNSADTLTSRKKHHTRRPQNTIQKIFRGEINKGSLGADYLLKIRTLFSQVQEDAVARRMLLELLLHVERYAELFDQEPAISTFGKRAGNTYLDALLAIVRHHEDWIRPLDTWRPESHNSRRQFSSLVRHLLARYDVPVFMDAAWFHNDRTKARQHQTWFKHIGSGGNIRTADIPVVMSKKMAHCFLKAPDKLTIEHAFRWAQVIGQNGSEQLANAVIHSRMGQTFAHEEFWATVIVFLIHNPMLDPSNIGPIIDYIHNQRFVPQEVVLPGGDIEMGDPPQPKYIMKGRSATKLLEQVDAWHRQLAAVVQYPEEGAPNGPKGHRRLVQWPRCSVSEFEYVEGKAEHQMKWSIQELLSNRDLQEEGKNLQHCVATYAKSCRAGSTSIWSLNARDARNTLHPVLTIAIDNQTKGITQARGKFNILPSSRPKARQKAVSGGYHNLLERSQHILQLWMDREGLFKAY